MIKGSFPVDVFREMETPFYFYDTELLQTTLSQLMVEANKYNYFIHYAVKANDNPRILAMIQQHELGADCVSGGEIKKCLDVGFNPEHIVFAGVGKNDREIELGLIAGIFCFNVESEQEIEVINQLAEKYHKIAHIALRINPEINPNTHHYITTGLAENKFGINLSQLEAILNYVKTLSHVRLIGLHFHIGSQITDIISFKGLCVRINEVQKKMLQKNIQVDHINVGGGLGIDYHHPNHYSIPDFAAYFSVFYRHLQLYTGQRLHFELGRSIVGQCGSLITKTLFVKKGDTKQFVIVDAGFTDLLRPALYQAYHRIENISSDLEVDFYDVVGPVCESSDCFGKYIELNKTQRGDLIAIRSAGAYGEVMASRYNSRRLPYAFFSDEISKNTND